jgi:hypothetical protein
MISKSRGITRRNTQHSRKISRSTPRPAGLRRPDAIALVGVGIAAVLIRFAVLGL